LSVTFDPVHDTPDVLAKYGQIWGAQARGWHLLTGPVEQVKTVCNLFGSNFWPEEGTLTHSLHTAVIDRKSKLVANVEGNQFTAEQLGDLIQTYF
jgi:protein SCO1